MSSLRFACASGRADGGISSDSTTSILEVGVHWVGIHKCCVVWNVPLIALVIDGLPTDEVYDAFEAVFNSDRHLYCRSR